nr:hypothetical protein [Tanacetum cinerariifolium]
MGIDYAAGGRLRKLRPDEAWATIEELAQYEDEGWNDTVIPGEESLNYENLNVKQLLGIMECKVDRLMKDTISLMGRSEGDFLASHGLAQAFFKSINKDPLSGPQWINLFQTNENVYRELVNEFFASFEFDASPYRELHNEGCFWPASQEAVEEDKEDDKADEAAGGGAGHEGAGGSAEIYRNMSQVLSSNLTNKITCKKFLIKTRKDFSKTLEMASRLIPNGVASPGM